MKKTICIILIIAVCAAALAVVCFGLAFVYSEYFHAETVDCQPSPDGRYTLELQQIGSPAWPYGPVTAQITLKQGDKTVAKQRTEVYNDGGPLYPSNWTVEWRDDSAVITVDLGEIDKNETIIFPLD